MSDKDQVAVWWEPLTEDEIKPSDKSYDMRTVEYDARGQSIRECRECSPWEAHVDIKDGFVIIREWHAVGCELAEIMRRDLATCHDTDAPGVYCATCGAYNANEIKPSS